MPSVFRGQDDFNTQGSIRSRVRVHTCNGNGSTNTAVRRWATVVENVGSDITYADSATLGGSFTINKDGIYAINYSDQYNNASTLVISNTNNNLNGVVAVGDILAAATTAAASYCAACSWCGFLAAGTVIRARNNGANPISGANTKFEQFSIVRVA